MIPFRPDPSWYATYWYDNPPPRWPWLRRLAAARGLLRHASQCQALVPVRPLIERHAT